MGMDINDALAQSPEFIKDFPLVQAMAQLIQSQAEQIQRQSEQILKLEETVKSLKDEISRLNKTPKRPKFKPNQMEPRNRGKKNPQENSSKNFKFYCASKKQQEEVKVQAVGVPDGSRFKGYTNFTVQDLEIIVKEITYKLEVWQTPDGKVIRAQLPKELKGKHFGPGLRTFIINLYAQGMTEPAIYDFLQGIGVKISTGQINHIQLDEAEEFARVSEEILQAGIRDAPYIRTDDTGARHKHKNGYCTHIGGEYFAYYKTTFSKSRANFLEILLQGKEGYRINEAMIWHLYQCGIEDDLLNLFEKHQGKKYTAKRGINRFLNSLNINGKKLRAQCLEGALVGYISEEILKKGQVLISDRAGQFAVFNHGGCWVHMERPLRKVSPTNESVKKELELARESIWKLYRTLKKSTFTQTERKEIEKQYDVLEKMKSTSPTISGVIKSFREYRDEMLKVLDHPGLPLHNNDSERDIRGFVKRRKISGSTKSELGRKYRDSLASIKQTCFRLGLSFWEHSSAWLQGNPPDLAQLVRERYQTAPS